MPKDVCDSQINTIKILKSHRVKSKQGFGCSGTHIQTVKKHYHTHQFRHSFKGFSHFHSGILFFFYLELQHLLNTAFQACEVNQSKRYVNSNQQQAEFLKAKLKWSVYGGLTDLH